MAPLIKQTSGRKIVHYWNQQTPLQRLSFVVEHMDLFWSMGLVTSSEVNMAQSLSEASKEYIVEREEQPIFTNIHLKKDVKDQSNAKKLRAALRAVFSCPKKSPQIKRGHPLNPQLSFG